MDQVDQIGLRDNTWTVRRLIQTHIDMSSSHSIGSGNKNNNKQKETMRCVDHSFAMGKKVRDSDQLIFINQSSKIDWTYLTLDKLHTGQT